jgi:integrase
MLTDAKLRTLKYKPLESKGEKNKGQLLGNRYPDKDGMYIYVSPTGTISFRYDFRWPRSATGKRQCVTHGRYPLMTLEDARDAHIEVLRKLKKGINPLDERRQERQQSELPDDFKAVAERWYEKNKPGKSNSWLKANRRYLDAAYPYIGGRKIKEIAARDISNIITPVEQKGKGVTAEKMRLTYVMVFDYAAGKEFLIASGANPARVLSVDVPDTKHHPHLSIAEVPPFLKAVEADSAAEQVKLAVNLLFLTLTRKMELCGAKWTELDLDAARWEIPAERMKGKRPHIVPLSSQAVTLFRKLKELAKGSEFVFPRPGRANQHITDGKLNEVFRRTGYAGKATPHGCRSTASTALNEMGFNADHIERQLSHVEADEVRASYNHADYMIERTRMLQAWADAIDRLCAGKPLVEAGKVIQLHAAA